MSEVAMGGDQLFRSENWPSLGEILQGYIPARRWFRGKARRVRSMVVQDAVPVPVADFIACLVLVRVDYAEGEPEVYALPLALDAAERVETFLKDHPNAMVMRLGAPGQSGSMLYDALVDKRFCDSLLEAIARGRWFGGEGGLIVASPTGVFAAVRGPASAYLEPSPVRAEQTNTSVIYGDRLILKLFRRVEGGLNPDLEIGRFLTERAHFSHVPPVAGAVEYQRKDGATASLAMLQGLVPNQGDAWDYTLDSLASYYQTVARSTEAPPIPLKPLTTLDGEVPALAQKTIGAYLEPARLLGQRTAGLHRALASASDDPDFAPEPFSAEYQDSLYRSMRDSAARSLQLLRQRLAELPEGVRGDAQAVLNLEGPIMERFQALRRRRIEAVRIRCHGDYHLGQVLYTGRDFVIIDFEGEPALPLRERRAKHSPLKDVAGMVRSFDYAAHTALALQASGMSQPEGAAPLEQWARFWYIWVAAAFFAAYRAVAARAGLLPEQPEQVGALLDVYLLNKALYEVGYELNNRPGWVVVPLRGVLQLMKSE